MAKPSKDEFLMQAIETVAEMAAQSTERIADLLPTDLFAAPQPSPPQPQQQAFTPRPENRSLAIEKMDDFDFLKEMEERKSLYSNSQTVTPFEVYEEI
jgi:hypothetical protein